MARTAKKESTEEFFRTKRHRAIVKHGLVESDLQAFFAIMANQKCIRKVLTVDGFAGPGRYSDGSDGSPIMICKTLLEHTLFIEKPELREKIHLVFIEAKHDRALRLKKNLKPFQERGLNIEIVQGEFKNEILEIMSTYNADANFVFADPFGYSGMPMQTLREILAYPRTDLLVNLMDSSVRRWREVNNKKELINELLGSTEWQNIDRNSKTFLEEFVDMYRQNLQSVLNNTRGSEFERIGTLKFAMRNANNSHVYHLVFATKHRKGMQIMKQAMFNYSGLRDGFMFSEFNSTTNSYQELRQRKLSLEHNAKDMAALVKTKFIGQTVTGAVIENFIIWDTNYHFNFKCQLKDELSHYIVGNVNANKGRAFHGLKYSFSFTEHAKKRSSANSKEQSNTTPVKKQRRNGQGRKAVDKSQPTLDKYFSPKK